MCVNPHRFAIGRELFRLRISILLDNQILFCLMQKKKKSLPTNNALLIQLYIDGGRRRCVGEHFGVEGVCCVVSLCCKLCIISSCHSMPLKVAYYYTLASQRISGGAPMKLKMDICY